MGNIRQEGAEDRFGDSLSICCDRCLPIKSRQGIRQIQPAVGCHARQDCLGTGYCRGSSPGRKIEHNAASRTKTLAIIWVYDILY